MTNLIYAPLIWAMIQVESGGNPTAVNKKEDAVGILQIRPCVITDVNEKYKTTFSSWDRLEIQESIHICSLYLHYWGYQYSIRTSKAPTSEILARIWNGGPVGWERLSTMSYWVNVHSYLYKVDTLHLCNVCGILTPHQICLKCNHMHPEQDSSPD